MSGVGTSGVSVVTGVSDSAGVGGAGAVWTPGGGGVAVYATLNASDKAATITLSGGNLVATTTTASWQLVRGNVSKSSGKYYYEVSFNSDRAAYGGTTEPMFGIARSTHSLTAYAGQSGAFGWAMQDKGPNALKFSPSAFPSYVASSGNAATRFGVYVDLDAGEISYSFNGVDKGVANSAQTFSTVYPALWLYDPGTPDVTATLYFNPSSWLYPSTYASASAWTA